MGQGHTKGPWRSYRPLSRMGLRLGYGVRQVGGSKGVVAAVYGPFSAREANARLIAAAPELLAECQVALQVYAMLGDREAFDRCKAVLARVDGGASCDPT